MSWYFLRPMAQEYYTQRLKDRTHFLLKKVVLDLLLLNTMIENSTFKHSVRWWHHVFCYRMRDFTLFSMAHIVTLILFFSTCCVLMFYRKKLKTNQLIIKWTLFSILLVCEISLHLWLILTKEWEVGDLPLQLCSLSTFLVLFLFLKKIKKRLICYFLSVSFLQF